MTDTLEPANWPVAQVHGDTLIPLTARVVIDGTGATIEEAWAEVRTARGTGAVTMLEVAATFDGDEVTFFDNEEITYDPGGKPFKGYWQGRVRVSAPIEATITILDGVFEVIPRVVQP